MIARTSVGEQPDLSGTDRGGLNGTEKIVLCADFGRIGDFYRLEASRLLLKLVTLKRIRRLGGKQAFVELE